MKSPRIKRLLDEGKMGGEKELILLSIKEQPHLYEGVKMVFSYCLQQNASVKLHMIQMLKLFSLQLGEAAAAAC